MPGPTTEVLNDDIKAVRDDLHKFQVAITADVRELTTQVRGILTAIKLLAVLAISTLGASIWWGATLTADVRNLDDQMEKRFQLVGERIDERFKTVDQRFDRIEASIAKILEQTKPMPKP